MLLSAGFMILILAYSYATNHVHAAFKEVVSLREGVVRPELEVCLVLSKCVSSRTETTTETIVNLNETDSSRIKENNHPRLSSFPHLDAKGELL